MATVSCAGSGPAIRVASGSSSSADQAPAAAPTAATAPTVPTLSTGGTPRTDVASGSSNDDAVSI